jgi:hypothetical protein
MNTIERSLSHILEQILGGQGLRIDMCAFGSELFLLLITRDVELVVFEVMFVLPIMAKEGPAYGRCLVCTCIVS